MVVRNKAWLGLVLAAVLVLPAAGQETPGAGILGVLVLPLTRDATAPGVPLPIMVSIINPDPRLQGRIEAWMGQRREASICEQTIDIGKGRFRFFLYPQSWSQYETQVFVRIVDNDGRIRHQSPVTLNRREMGWRVGAVPGKDRSLAGQHLGSLEDLVLNVLSTERLPDQWYGYKLFDAFLWDGGRTEPLDPVRRQALSDWVRSGGKLVLTARAGDTTVISPIPELVPSFDLAPVREQARGIGELTFFDAKEFPAEEGAPLARKAVGLGNVIFLRVDPTTLTAWPKTTLEQIMGPRRSPFVDPNYRSHDYEKDIRSLLAYAAGYSEFSFTPVLSSMLVYLVMISIVDFTVLKKLKKLPWTWLTFPSLILLFALFSFFLFYQGRLSDRVRYELCFHDIGGDGQGRVRTMSCIRQNNTKPVQFGTEAAHFLTFIGPGEAYPWHGGRRAGRRRQNEERIIESFSRAGDKHVTLPGYIGTFHFFGEEWVEPAAALPFSCNLRATRLGVGGTITRNTSEKVADAFLLYKDRVYDLDDQFKIGDLHTAVHSTFYRHRHGAAKREVILLSELMHWAMNTTMSILSAGDKPYAEGQPMPRPRRILFAPIPGDDEAVLFAFFEEKDEYAGIPLHRIKCIRQTVPVEKEGSSS